MLKAGTYDEIFGPGSTPQYANPETEYKYADDQIVETEQGWKLNFSVSVVILHAPALHTTLCKACISYV